VRHGIVLVHGFTGTPFEMRWATPEQGEHTDAVLREAGYDAAAIADFRKRGVI